MAEMLCTEFIAKKYSLASLILDFNENSTFVSEL